MKIEKIKKMKNGKYKLSLDNKTNIITYDNVILDNNLLFNKEIDNEKLNQLIIDNNYYDIYNKVVKYISIRMRSKLEIENYLDKLGITDLKDKFISDLIKSNLIDDCKFAKAYIYDQINLTKKGPNKIKKELLNHKISEEIINDELNKYDNKIFINKIDKLISKKINSNNKYSNYILKEKIINELINLGYEKADILECLENATFKDNDIIEKDFNNIYNRLIKKYDGNNLLMHLKNKLYIKGYKKEEIDEIIKNKMDS